MAHFLIGPDPGAIQAEVAYRILGALNDGHLAELDVMVRHCKSGAGCALGGQSGRNPVAT